ncbi:MAG: response regulator [Rhodospirillales bacterium]|nr:response regulator [Rhodospirillales bacterium]
MTTTAKRVLVCDDDPLMRKLLSRLLTMMGCDVVGEAEDGNEGVALFRENGPDLTLMDINMPGKNGVDALNEIIKMNAHASVVMLSAMDDTVVAESCLHKGAIGYIQKGTDMGALQIALKEYIA